MDNDSVRETNRCQRISYDNSIPVFFICFHMTPKVVDKVKAKLAVCMFKPIYNNSHIV